jgi:hypothetical protein
MILRCCDQSREPIPRRGHGVPDCTSSITRRAVDDTNVEVSEIRRREPRVVVDKMPAVSRQSIAGSQLGRVVRRIYHHDEVARFELRHVMLRVLALGTECIHGPKQPGEQSFAFAFRIDLANTALAAKNVHIRFGKSARDKLFDSSFEVRWVVDDANDAVVGKEPALSRLFARLTFRRSRVLHSPVLWFLSHDRFLVRGLRA